MAELNISASTTTNMTDNVPAFIVEQIALDAVSPASDETYWYFSKATTYYGYYLSIPEIFSAANSLATWTTHKGWKAKDPDTKNGKRYIYSNNVESRGS